MCCVVGYIGQSVSKERILEGLTRLEYRGYDSAGCAFLERQNTIKALKVVGGVDKLRAQSASDMYEGTVGIGHTRWSTHGAVTWENAHPVFDCTGSVAVVHNGIIEQERSLRQQLAATGHRFHSETDSELIAHCFEEELATLELRKAAECAKPESGGESGLAYQLLRAVVSRLQGAYAFVAMVDRFPGILFSARHRSPLCLGKSSDGIFVASDPLAFAGDAPEVIFIPDASYALVAADSYTCWSALTHEVVPLTPEPLTLTWSGGGKQGYEHFMVKEIYEQHEVIRTIVQHALREKSLVALPSAADISSLQLIGCGTSLHAAQLGRWYYEAIAQIPTQVVMASELRERPLFAKRIDATIALSQSGETADTLEAVRALKLAGVPVVAITNVVSSSLAREALAVVPMHAGVEVAVASTKSFAAQVSLLYSMAYEAACARGILPETAREAALDALAHAADCLHEGIMRSADRIDRVLAPRYAKAPHAIFIGREMGYVLAQEAALKLKEIAYIFSEAYAAGELKHGPLALIAPEVPVFVCSVLEPSAYRKLVANVQEVRSRRGHLVIIAFEGQDDLMALADELLVVPLPKDPLLGPLVMTGVLQYLVYRCAYELHLPIDKPRNLAKSVTVE